MFKRLKAVLKETSIVEYSMRIFEMLSTGHRRKIKFIILITFVNSFIEVIGLAFIIPVIYLINNTDPIYNNKILHSIYVFIDPPSEQHFILIIMIALIFVFIFKNVVSIFSYYILAKFSFDVSLDIVNRQFTNFLTSDEYEVMSKNSNYQMREIGIVPTEFANNVLLPMLTIYNEIMVIVIIMVGLIIYKINILLLIILTILPFVFILTRLTKRRHVLIGKRKDKVEPLTYKNLFESIYNMIDIKLYNKIDYFRTRTVNAFGGLFKVYESLIIHKTLPQKLLEIVIVTTIAMLYVFIVFVVGGSVDHVVMTLALFASAAYRFMPSADRILGAMISIRSSDFVFDIIVKESELRPQIKHDDLTFNETIELKDICYVYPNTTTDVLNHLNLSIKKGSYVGIMGESGSGKSTLLKIIVRLLKENNGTLEVDGKKSIDIAQWHSIIGYVSQDLRLIDSTMAENIAFGVDKENIDQEQLLSAINNAGLSNLVNNLEDGIETIIGEDGSSLSSGQKQRISLARALYQDAQLIILDEATNALDVATEDKIIASLKALNDLGLTILQVSHRMSSFVHCDVIHEIDHGKVTRSVTYDQLA